MAVAVKICGVNSVEAAEAATAAQYVGFVFYPPSPRAVSAETAATLAVHLPDTVTRTGLFVDAEDAAIAAVLARTSLDLLQLHGEESPERIAEVREKFGLPVMKAIKVATKTDVDAAAAYFSCADHLLFDARPPATMEDALPGGNALAFDWGLLAGRDWPLPWMLSGGLRVENLAQAVRISGAPVVDVSSGVEFASGHKNPAFIRAFIDEAAKL
ncbi:MAG: phosphoribosylanthranilate isomerase [Alphaproteobacteria bacterium]|nr:phosphoribosylanthranilate isomerase [Alphaproteobacteria bacterium]MEE1568681.1 phosphoribosylanthranilate isomerase [Alphaproteobacteria bacterium]|tara:strand:- start:308 stop:949 length:642 start_codon:yes stop_codon:yes gene_type:complete